MADQGTRLSNGPARGILLSLLDRFPIPEVRKLWEMNADVLRSRYPSESEWYRQLWLNKDGLTPFLFERISNSMEAFLWKHGLAMGDFFDERMFRFEQGGIWESEENLAWIRDFLPKLYQDPEPLVTLERLLCHWGEKAQPGSHCQIPYFHKSEGQVASVFSFATDAEFRFRAVFPFPDSTAVFIRIFPRFFGLPPFQNVETIASCQHPDHLLWDEAWEIRDEIFRIGKARYGRVVGFSNWARERELRFQGQPPPDRKVILMEADYVCPFRKRAVLRKGCIYDAPLYLARVDYSLQPGAERPHASADYLGNIIAGVTRKDSEAWKRLEDAYQNLIAAAVRAEHIPFHSKLEFSYKPGSQLLLLNGTTLISGTPALILRKILLAYRGGQTIFDFRSFKHDTAIFPNPKRTNFEVRWSRLRERLRKSTTLVALERAGEGKFSFLAKAPLEFREAE